LTAPRGRRRRFRSGSPFLASSSPHLGGIEDGLVSALQDRGLVRKARAREQFRDNLLEF